MSDGQSDSRREMDSGGWTLNNAPPVRSSAGLAGVELIKAERLRQISQEGWTLEHDDTHDKGEMAQAAASYALHAAGISSSYPKGIANGCCLWWPWAKRWWKPRTPIKDLVRAGALIAAEIDRLQRKEAKPANHDSTTAG